ncbi:MAG: VOC family protein [Betaproteobacteria bacterium]|nr:VOC family protein [Betaproteobacteria bacterium]
MIDRFDHLVIHPSDFERSLAFYRDTLGWPVVAQWGDEAEPRCAVLSGGAVKVVLAERAKGAKADTRPELRLDIHDVVRRFALIPPGDHVVRPPGESAEGPREFVVCDPDGNRIAFEEVHRSRA